MSLLLWMLLAATGFAIVEMAATHAVAKKIGNNGIVDVVWSAGFGGIAVLYALLAPPLADGTHFDLRRCLLLVMVLGWSLRLGLHLYVRVRKHHPHEDVRYAQLRKEWGADVDRRMFGFFQLQGAIQVVLSIPWLLSFLKNVPTRHTEALSPWEISGAVLWILALVGESVADRQLASFRADPANRGTVCQLGLWNYSRHPNYFFEWLVWVAFFLFACGSPYGWLSLVAPVLMWHFLVNVTGIPMTEELSVRSKGDAYREYQRSTSAFVPWFKRVSPQP
jgi:steroid 5-alpha reductase family enzyme